MPASRNGQGARRYGWRHKSFGWERTPALTEESQLINLQKISIGKGSHTFEWHALFNISTFLGYIQNVTFWKVTRRELECISSSKTLFDLI